MSFPTHPDHPASVLEENLKRGLTEPLLLSLLSEQPRYIGELTELIRQRSNGDLTIVFPYAAIYRLLDAGYITETKKAFAPDGRRRQYYSITDTGRAYLQDLLRVYDRVTQSVRVILEGGAEK